MTKLTRWSERGSDEEGWCVEITFDGVEYTHQSTGDVHEARKGVLRMVAAYYNSEIPVPRIVTADGFIYRLNRTQGWIDLNEE